MNGFVLQAAGVVGDEWIDHNDHMNVVRYFALFEEASHKLWKSLAQVGNGGADLTMVASRFYIEHRQELLRGQEWQIWSGIADVRPKSLTMVHRITGVAAHFGRPPIRATCEVLATAFSMKRRAASVLTPDLMTEAQGHLIPGYRARLGILSSPTSTPAPASDASLKGSWQIVVFIVEGKGNHAGLYIPGHGLADLSLAGARIVGLDDKRFPKGIPEAFPIHVPAPEAALAFLGRAGALCREIIAQEKAQPGWHLTPDAPDYVLKLRAERSRDPKNMNCVEWIAHALELGGAEFPADIMTPEQLRQWCRLQRTTWDTPHGG